MPREKRVLLEIVGEIVIARRLVEVAVVAEVAMQPVV